MPARSLLNAIIDAGCRTGSGFTIAGDHSGASLTYRTLLLRSAALSAPLCRALKGEQNIGVMLPSTLAALVTFVSLHLLQKLPCMLNFSAGPGNLLHACRIAQVKTVLTSRAFVAQAKLEEAIAALEAEVRVLYLEDMREKLRLGDKLTGLLVSRLPRLMLSKILAADVQDRPAVILYTSGSEGTPKGVALSHRNILSNIAQAESGFNFTAQDVLFNPLPVFHSFGLTVGTLLPLTLGIRFSLYPSPLHYKQIPPLVKSSGASIFLGTDTFYQGYARSAQDDEFAGVRLAIAGAEKLKDSTRELYKQRFGIDIFQGYGVTETSPILSCNTPQQHRPGSVGRLFKTIEGRVAPVEGFTRGGELMIKGENVMLGYLKADQPGVIQPQGEWYGTGDIVEMDADGYIFILGRAKRFAKIGGEMVSLLAVEELAAKAEAETAHAAVAISDERKGEQIVLFSESQSLTRDALLSHVQEMGVSELYLPRRIELLETIPRLGNGKIDYQTLKKMAA